VRSVPRVRSGTRRAPCARSREHRRDRPNRRLGGTPAANRQLRRPHRPNRRLAAALPANRHFGSSHRPNCRFAGRGAREAALAPRAIPALPRQFPDARGPRTAAATPPPTPAPPRTRAGARPTRVAGRARPPAILDAVRVKFCGITNLEDAEAAVELGAWAIGLNHWEGSPRRVEPEVASEIAAAVRRR